MITTFIINALRHASKRFSSLKVITIVLMIKTLAIWINIGRVFFTIKQL